MQGFRGEAAMVNAPMIRYGTAMIIDMHTHAGRPRRTGDVDRAVLATMRPAGVAAAVVAAIADIPVIRRDPVTKRLIKVREPLPGECLEATLGYLDSFGAAGMRIAREPDDIRADDPALVLAVEGCDFLDGDLDRLNAMEARGVRSIQLTHYLVNETGDIQTAPPVHGGLTRFGAEAVRRMNRIGVIVDVAHCSVTRCAAWRRRPRSQFSAPTPICWNRACRMASIRGSSAWTTRAWWRAPGE